MSDLSIRVQARIDEIGNAIDDTQRRLPALGAVASTIRSVATQVGGELTERLQMESRSGALFDRFHAELGKVRDGVEGPVTDREIGMALTMVVADVVRDARERLTRIADDQSAEVLRTEGELEAMRRERAALRYLLADPTTAEGAPDKDATEPAAAAPVAAQ